MGEFSWALGGLAGCQLAPVQQCSVFAMMIEGGPVTVASVLGSHWAPVPRGSELAWGEKASAASVAMATVAVMRALRLLGCRPSEYHLWACVCCRGTHCTASLAAFLVAVAPHLVQKMHCC